MRLESEIGKDARQFMREGRTLMLLLAAPLLVLIVMGSIFSGDSTLVGKTAIGICDLDSSNASVFFTSGIMNSSEIINYGKGADCPLWAPVLLVIRHYGLKCAHTSICLPMS